MKKCLNSDMSKRPSGWQRGAVPAHGCWLCYNSAVALWGVTGFLPVFSLSGTILESRTKIDAVQGYTNNPWSMNSVTWKWNRGGANRFSWGSLPMDYWAYCTVASAAEERLVVLPANSNYCPRYSQYFLIRWPVLFLEQRFSSHSSSRSPVSTFKDE